MGLFCHNAAEHKLARVTVVQRHFWPAWRAGVEFERTIRKLLTKPER